MTPAGYSTLRSFWLWLIEPPASMKEQQRRQARFLSQILLSLNLFTVIGIVAFVSWNPLGQVPLVPFFVAVAGDVVAFTIAYVLNRTGHYLGAASLTVGILSVTMWGAILAYWNNPESVLPLLLYVMICVLLSSVLLSVRTTLAVFAVHMALGLLALAFIPRQVATAFVNQLLFISFSVALILAATAFRRQGEARIEQQTRALAESEEKYRRIIETAQEGIWMLDASARTTFVNRRMAEMLGYAEVEMLGRPLYDFVDETARLAAEDDFRRRRQGIAERRDFKFRRKDSSDLWAIVSTQTVVGDDGQFSGALGLITDITERKEAEEALQVVNEELTRWIKELEQRTREIGLINELGELLQTCLIDAEAFTVISSLGPRLFPEEMGVLYAISASRNWMEVAATWGISPADLGEHVFAPDDCWALRRGRMQMTDSGQGAPLCAHLHGAPPGVYVCAPLVAQGEALGVLNLRSPTRESMSKAKQQLARTVADAIALALANLKLHEILRLQSIRDPLTGLFNRRYLEETLEREVRRASRNERPLGVIMLDIDRFKHFNDTFGHAAGDTLLRALGELLRSRVRAEDIPCRYGGEEFVLILPESPLDVTQRRAELLRTDVKQLHPSHAGQSLGGVTVSIGVATFPDHGLTGEVVLRAADEALYRAKHEGRDRVVVSTV